MLLLTCRITSMSCEMPEWTRLVREPAGSVARFKSWEQHNQTVEGAAGQRHAAARGRQSLRGRQNPEEIFCTHFFALWFKGTDRTIWLIFNFCSLWSPYGIGQTIIFLPCGYFFFSSPNLSRRRLDVCHTSTHGVALMRISDACLKPAARGSLKTQDAKKSPKIAIWAPSHNFVGLYLRN